MLDHATAILTRLLQESERTLIEFERSDVEPVGGGLLIGYACVVSTTDGRRERVTVYVNSSPDAPTDASTVELLEPDGRRLTAWVYPQDPALPALPAVSYPEAASVVLGKFGIDGAEARLSMEAYRPGKRAVLRIDTGGGSWFAKVVHPELAASIHELHERFRAADVLVPRSLGFSDNGLVLLDPLPGVSALSVFETIDRAQFRAELTALVRRIERVPMRQAARESLARRASWYADRMHETAPQFSAQSRNIADHITALYQSTPTPPPVTVHGDLHLGQIFVDPEEPSRITGILDIDTAGLGDPADDAGALYGHVVVSATDETAPTERADALRAFQAELEASWQGDGRTAAIAATHLLGHALAGAGRRSPHGEEVAAELLQCAEELLGRYAGGTRTAEG